MATFDQLPAEQRAIIELVVTRGRSYEALADVLQVPASRVRELARDALVELSPVSGERVDPQWRSQIADYVLGQQSSAESTATRAHISRSEPARTWALSLLDSLDSLFANGDRPPIPDPAEGVKRGDGAGPAVAVADGEGEERAEEEASKSRERGRERAGRGRKTDAAAAEKDEEKEKEKEGDRDSTPSADRAALSPEAQAALRRRRIMSGVLGLLVLAGIVVGILAIAGVFSSDSKSTTASSGSGGGSSTTPATSAQQTQVIGQIPLQPVSGAKAQGVAYILKQGTKQVLAVTAKLPPLPATQRRAAYNVWLFNSPKDAYSIGAQFTTPQGDYQGVGALPSNWQRYKFVDVSIQPFNKTTAHSGNSVLRGAFANLRPVPQNQQGSTGTGTTPAP